MLRVLRSANSLPDSFMFGVATADHQCEAYDEKVEDIWDLWERYRGLQRRQQATDFWARFGEDIVHARELGCKAFRFSIAWSRVEPAPGQYDEAAFDHYRQLIATIRANNMEPILTLHHFTWPVHVEERGGMRGDQFPDIFKGYVAEVVKRLGKGVRYWLTFNEPSQLVYGYIKPWWDTNYRFPPGLPESTPLDDQFEAVLALIRNLFKANALAYDVIKAAYPNAQVGANPLPVGVPTWLQALIDGRTGQIHGTQDLKNHVQRLVERPFQEQGEVDVVLATLSDTPEREQQVAFSQVYFVTGQKLLVKRGSAIGAAQDLAAKTVAAVKSTTAEANISRLLPQAHPLSVSDYPAALQALDQGQADAILADETILQGLLDAHPGQYALAGDFLTNEPYAAAVALGNIELLDVVDRAVQRFKQQHNPGAARGLGPAEPSARPMAAIPPPTVRSLADVLPAGASRAIVAPATAGQPLPAAKPGTALRRIQDRGYVIVAVRQDLPGFGYRDPATGQWSGLEIELGREIARQIFGDPDKVRFRPVTSQERIPLLRSLTSVLVPLLKYYSFLGSMFISSWWYLGMSKQIPTLCPPEYAGKLDFVGFDYYWGISKLRIDRIKKLIDTASGAFDHAPVYPGALYDLLQYHHSLFPDLPILLIENGSVPQADGMDRSTYIRKHVAEVQRAVRAGVKVVAYVCWSITTNREWGLRLGQGNDFGLYQIDLDKDPMLTRKDTGSRAVYHDIIANGGV